MCCTRIQHHIDIHVIYFKFHIKPFKAPNFPCCNALICVKSFSTSLDSTTKLPNRATKQFNTRIEFTYVTTSSSSLPYLTRMTLSFSLFRHSLAKCGPLWMKQAKFNLAFLPCPPDDLTFPLSAMDIDATPPPNFLFFLFSSLSVILNLEEVDM